jgi:FtsZ-binding cell division protein ZapB
MATRGRPKKIVPEVTITNEKDYQYHMKVVALKDVEIESLKELNKNLSLANERLLKNINEMKESLADKKTKDSLKVDELDSEIGKLEDENEHLREIIKSLAEVL